MTPGGKPTPHIRKRDRRVRGCWLQPLGLLMLHPPDLEKEKRVGGGGGEGGEFLSLPKGNGWIPEEPISKPLNSRGGGEGGGNGKPAGTLG